VPFGREALNSSSELQFIDRTHVDAFFHPEYDRGAMLGGQLGKKQWFGYQAGVFNGEGENKRNDDGDWRYSARVNFDPFGYFKPSQSDFGRSKTQKLSFAIDAMIDDLAKVNERRESYGFDFSWAYKGFTVDGEYVTASHDSGGANDFDADGWHLQAGFMLYKDMVELAVRYASLDADFPDAFVGEGPDWLAGRGFKTLGKTTSDGMGGISGAIYDQLDITTLGLNFYFDGHANKLMLDYNWVNEDGFGSDAHDLSNDVARVMYQIKF
jgi:hypothetical protein